MFWLLVTYLLMITRCEYTDGKFTEDIGCIVAHNKPVVASMIIIVTNSQYFSVNILCMFYELRTTIDAKIK